MFIVDKMPQSLSAESYRSIRTSIKYSSLDHPIKSIVVTSAQSGEGKSTVAGNLAFSLSQDGSKVLIIDCDLRNPSLHEKFEVSVNKGITDVLFEKDKLSNDLIKINDKLFLLPCGTIPPNPAEILGSHRMEEFLGELTKSYDYIVIDTPPVMAVTDAQLLAAKADATVLVVRANTIKGKVVLNSYKELEKVKANVIGTILNDYDNLGERLYYKHKNDKKIFKFFKKFKK